jgi:hypothetical protein
MAAVTYAPSDPNSSVHFPYRSISCEPTEGFDFCNDGKEVFGLEWRFHRKVFPQGQRQLPKLVTQLLRLLNSVILFGCVLSCLHLGPRVRVRFLG